MQQNLRFTIRTEHKKIATNVFFLILVQFANYISPLLILPYLSRTLDISVYGFVAVIYSLINLCLVVSDFGFSLSAPYYIASNVNSKEKINTYLGSVFLAKFVLVLLSIALIGLYVLYSETGKRIGGKLFLIVSLIIVIQSYQPTWFFQGIEKLSKVSIYTVTAKLSYFLFVLLFVKSSKDFPMVFISYLIGQILASIIGIGGIYSEGYRISRPRMMQIIDTVSQSSMFFLSRISVSVYTTACTFIVGNFAGYEQAALYSSAEKLYQGGQSLTIPISQAAYPYLARTKDKRFVGRYVLLILIPLSLGSLVIFIYAKNIMSIFLGNSFFVGGGVFKTFVICNLVTFVSINFGYPAFSSIDRLDIANKSVIIGSLVQAGLLFLLIVTKNVNAFSIVCSVLISEVFVMLFRLINFFKLR